MPGSDHRLRFESFGVCAELISDDRDLLQAMSEALPPGWRSATNQPGVTFRITTDGKIVLDEETVVGRAREPSDLLVQLTSALRLHIAGHAADHIFIHAGVVAVRGSAIVIPGRSLSGKTTLVAELVRQGATYYSDEYAVVDPDGLIQPFAQPLSPRHAGHSHRRDRVAVSSAQTGQDLIRAGLIVVTSFEANAEWQPRPSTAGEGAMALLENTVQARLRPKQAIEAAGRLARDAAVVVGTRGEAGQVAEALLGDSALIQSA